MLKISSLKVNMRLYPVGSSQSTIICNVLTKSYPTIYLTRKCNSQNRIIHCIYLHSHQSIV